MAFRPKRPQNPTLWSSTYLYGVYKGVPPPPSSVQSCSNNRSISNYQNSILQKCWDLSSDISKTSDPLPPLPPQRKLNFEHHGWIWVLFMATTLLWGRRGDNGINPKPVKKLSLGAKCYITITRNSSSSTQSKVLLSSIVDSKTPTEQTLLYSLLLAPKKAKKNDDEGLDALRHALNGRQDQETPTGFIVDFVEPVL